MKKSAIITAVFLTISVTGWSQPYYEASGQTQVFTLKAGAKTGPTAIRGGLNLRNGINSGITVLTTRGGIAIDLPALQRGTADIAIYDIKGRQVYRRSGISGASVRLETRTFAPGIYSLLVRADGMTSSRRVAVNGRGE